MSQQKQDDSNYVTLVLKEGKEFSASRNVLSAASPFFSALLDSDMREKKEGIIRMEHTSDTVMRDILEFMNSGTVKLTSTNVQDLIEAADYLVLPSLKTIAERFIEKNLSTSNCISIYYFAEKYQCEELMVNTRKFIFSLNFANVAKSRDFLNLESQQVERWISSDEINVSKEDDVFKIILKWIEQSKSERKGKFEELFRHVRLALLSRGYLERDVVTNDLVKENPGCLKLVRDAVYRADGGNDDDLQQSPRKMFQKQAIVVFGGKAMFCYLPDKDLWYQIPDPHSDHRYYHVSSFKGKLYVFPTRRKPVDHYYDERYQLYPSNVTYLIPERYDPSLNSWMSLAREKQKNGVYRSAAVSIGDEICSIEHFFYRDRKTTRFRVIEDTFIKKFDVATDSWKQVSSTLEIFYEEQACVLTMDNYLYVIGNDSAKRFDTVDEMRCDRIARTLQPRYNACGVAARGKIFIAGGEITTGKNDVRHCAQSCEVYNVSTNEWQYIARLNIPRSHASMVCIEGTLYVVGGLNDHFGCSEVLEIESFDLESDSKWTKRTTIPPAQGHRDWKACTLTVYPGMLKKPITRETGDDY